VSKNTHVTPKTQTFCFTVPACLEYRDAARGFLAFICDELVMKNAMPVEAAHHITSAFIEAFNNSVVHAYRGTTAGSVDLRLQVSPYQLQLELAETGRPFRAESIQEPDLDALPEGGLGLFIIRRFMDRVSYRREGERNVLRMEKDLPNPPESAEMGRTLKVEPTK
jgi:serine/threonine-protein kinase RsbW